MWPDYDLEKRFRSSVVRETLSVVGRNVTPIKFNWPIKRRKKRLQDTAMEIHIILYIIHMYLLHCGYWAFFVRAKWTRLAKKDTRRSNAKRLIWRWRHSFGSLKIRQGLNDNTRWGEKKWKRRLNWRTCVYVFEPRTRFVGEIIVDFLKFRSNYAN